MSSHPPPPSDATAAADDHVALRALQQEVASLRDQLARAQRRLDAREALLEGLSLHIPGVLFKGVVGEDGRFHLHYISQRAAELYELDASRPEALDADASTRDIPRVALSADAMPDRIQAAQAHGFRAYLTKPLDVTALLRCLDEQLAQAGPQNGLR